MIIRNLSSIKIPSTGLHVVCFSSNNERSTLFVKSANGDDNFTVIIQTPYSLQHTGVCSIDNLHRWVDENGCMKAIARS